MRRLDEMMVHYGPHRGRIPESDPLEKKLLYLQNGLQRYGPKADGLLKLVNGLERIPEGREWLATNTPFLQALQRNASDPRVQEDQSEDSIALSNRLRDLLPKSLWTPATNLIDAPSPLSP